MLTGKLLLLPFTKIRFTRNLGVQFGATIWRYIFGGTCWGTILGYNLGVQFNEKLGVRFEGTIRGTKSGYRLGYNFYQFELSDGPFNS